MAASRNLYMNVLALAVTAAEKAGEIIREVMSSGNLEIVLKGVNDPQTAADRSAQVTISAILRNKFPNLTIIGEEDVAEKITVPDYSPSSFVLKNKCPSNLIDVTEEDIVVWVDPLDGTTEFTQGLVEHVTVLIGLAVKGEAVGGVIHQPYWCTDGQNKGRSVWGTVGGGVGGELKVTSPPSDGLILVTSRSHSNDLVESAVSSLNASQVIRVGGAGNKILYLLEGKAHCYVFPTPGCKRWDTCGPEAILKAAGGVLTDTNGKVYNYDKETDHVNSSGVLASLDLQVHKNCLSVLTKR